MRLWHKALDAANVPRMHLHDLRHTGNTLSAQTGATLRELMAHAGHSSSRAALGYLHEVRDCDRAIAEGLDELVEKSRRGAAKKKRDRRRKRAG